VREDEEKEAGGRGREGGREDLQQQQLLPQSSLYLVYPRHASISPRKEEREGGKK